MSKLSDDAYNAQNLPKVHEFAEAVAKSFLMYQRCKQEEADQITIGGSVLYRICRPPEMTIGFHLSCAPGDFFVRLVDYVD